VDFKTDFLNHWDQLLKEGKLPEVQLELEKLSASSVPRKNLYQVAQVSRRAGLPEIGLRLLSPYVRPKNRGLQVPTPDELSEYAVLLQRIGSLKEAWQLLEREELRGRAEVLLYKTYVLFNEWKYAEAIPQLESYLEATGISEYQRAIGKVNLLSALSFVGDYDKANKLFPSIESQLKEAGHLRLLANIYEIQCGAFFRQGNISGAQRILEGAEKLVTSKVALDALYIQKWSLILAAQRTGDCQPLYEFKEVARENGQAEIERDSDFHLLKIRFDANRANHLYAGTPYSSYRRLMLRSFHWAEPKEDYVWGHSGETLDLREMSWKGATVFRKDSLQHRALLFQLSDLYQARNVGGIFSNIYPDEYFDVDSSTLRVHQLVKRVREKIEELEIPISLELGSSGYKIRKKSLDVRLRLPLMSEATLESGLALENDERLEKLRFLFGQAYFKIDEGAECLGLSRSTMQRYLGSLLERGLLETAGAGRGKLYRLK